LLEHFNSPLKTVATPFAKKIPKIRLIRFYKKAPVSRFARHQTGCRETAARRTIRRETARQRAGMRIDTMSVRITFFSIGSQADLLFKRAGNAIAALFYKTGVFQRVRTCSPKRTIFDMQRIDINLSRMVKT
jgi:hypothetical protein